MFNRMEPYREFYQTFKNCSKGTLQDALFCSAIVGFRWVKILINVMNILVLVGCVVLFITLLSVRPKDFLYLKYHVYGGRCPFHSNYPSVSLGHEIIVHLNLLRHWAYDLTFLTLWMFTSALKRNIVGCVLRKITLQRRIRAFRSLCRFFSCLIGLLFGTVLGAIFIVIYLVSVAILIFITSPAVTSFIFLLKKFAITVSSFRTNSAVVKHLLSALHFLLFVYSNFPFHYICPTWIRNFCRKNFLMVSHGIGF